MKENIILRQRHAKLVSSTSVAITTTLFLDCNNNCLFLDCKMKSVISSQDKVELSNNKKTTRKKGDSSYIKFRFVSEFVFRVNRRNCQLI